MRVYICRIDDREVNFYVEINHKYGHTIYEKDGELFVEILNNGGVWHAPDAEFKPIASGTYIFDAKGKPQKVS